MNRAGGVASTPYQAYGGQETAPINAQQTAGIGAINTAQGNITATGAPISAADIQKYEDPYTNQVIQATQADFDTQNARQQSQTTGNAAAQGALGGDRSAVAAALTAEGQTRAQAPVIAGLRSAGYAQGVNTAENQQQQALRAGVAGLQGAQSMVGAGTQEQQTQQAQDTQQRQDYYQQQGYPFQVAQWLASIDTGVGSQLGGTSTGTNTGTSTTQGPTPNPWTQVAGLGLSAASMFANRGGRVSGVHRYAEGGGVGDDFNTQLSPADEQEFQAWKAINAPRDSGADYDLRGAYQANMQRDPDNGHMGDRFKKPNHPTFSDQSQYAVGDQRDRAGSWVGPEGPNQMFVPPANKWRGGRAGVHSYADGGRPRGFAGNTEYGDHSTIELADRYGPKVEKWPYRPFQAPWPGEGDADPNKPAYFGERFDAVKKADGGRAGIHSYASGGSPWGNDQTWVPQVSGITAGRGAPSASIPGLPSAPSAPKQQGLTDAQMKGIGTLGKSGAGAFGNWMNTGDTGVSLSDLGTSQNPLPGLDASDYRGGGPGGNEMFASRGGRIRRYANGGFAYGGAPDDTTFDDRFSAAYPQMAAGVGAARPAFADEPIRMPSQEAMDAWRAGVDRDKGLGLTAPESPQDDTPLPPEVMTGRSKAPIAAPTEPEEDPSTALAYSGARPLIRGVAAPAAAPEIADEGGFLSRLGIHASPELKQGLLQAGLSMMATHRGGPGSFLGSLGEAGMAGVGAYSQSQQLEQARQDTLRKEAFEHEKFERPYSEMTAAQKAADERANKDKVPFGWKVNEDGSITKIAGGPQDPATIREQAEAKQSGGISDSAVEVMARQGASGDQSWAKNIGRGAQSAKTIERVRNRMADILINENGKTPAEAAKMISEATRDWSASQIGANAGARTKGNREENLNLILKATDAAIPAALEASRNLPRGEFVPLTKIIQAGQVMTSDPRLAEFGMANLQLAEHWARAMNPLGVMRESDRDLALKYLSTATSQPTYERVVNQLKKQITRERDAVRGNAPEATTQPSPAAIQKLQDDPKLSSAFDEKYGVGASKRYLGK